MVPWICLQCVIGLYPEHTHFLYSTKPMHYQDLSWDHSVNLCKLVRVIAIAWIECDHFCIYICIEISAAIFSIKDICY